MATVINALEAATAQIRSMGFAANSCAMAASTFYQQFFRPRKTRAMVARLRACWDMRKKQPRKTSKR